MATRAFCHVSVLIGNTGLLFMLFTMSPLQSQASQAAFLSNLGHRNFSKEAFYGGVMNAAGSTLGCGGPVSQSKLIDLRNRLLPIWHALPKRYGRIDRRSLRHVVHRYFMKTSSIMVRGFEPARLINDSHWGVADILSDHLPAYVESMLESRQALAAGFSLEDAVNVITTLDRLILDSDASLLRQVYKDHGKNPHQRLNLQSVREVLEDYMIHWLVDAEEEEMQVLLDNRTLTEEIVPDFRELVRFLEGMVKSYSFQSLFSGAGVVSHRDHTGLWDSRYSFTDVHEVVGSITKSFHGYWYSECATMKETLVAMDSHRTGRVPLARFYARGVETDWRFGESLTYLRELGALDETSTWRGSQVLIPNYLQGTSNCFVNTQYYRICCPNECEDYFREIELEIGAAIASPSKIVMIVQNISLTMGDDVTMHLDRSLTKQLEQIAITHGGVVPLHGRLFAQWLHYVFPQDCAFPHRSGKVSLKAPTEFGEHFSASENDMRKFVASSDNSTINESMSKEDLEWMSQWSSDEESLIDDRHFSGGFGRTLVLLIAAVIVVGMALRSSADAAGSTTQSKKASPSHWV